MLKRFAAVVVAVLFGLMTMVGVASAQESPSPSPTETVSPTPEPSETGGPTTEPTDEPADELPTTGPALPYFIGGAAVLLLLGAGFLAIRKRKYLRLHGE